MGTPAKPIIAVIGDAQVEPGGLCDLFAEKVGRLIIDSGYRLQTGGRGGVMEAAGRGDRVSTNWTPSHFL